MANSLNADIEGKIIVLKEDCFAEKREPYRRLFKVTGGFGTKSFTSGTALFGEFMNGNKFRMSGYDVERLATEEEIKAATT